MYYRRDDVIRLTCLKIPKSLHFSGIKVILSFKGGRRVQVWIDTSLDRGLGISGGLHFIQLSLLFTFSQSSKLALYSSFFGSCRFSFAFATLPPSSVPPLPSHQKSLCFQSLARKFNRSLRLDSSLPFVEGFSLRNLWTLSLHCL